MISETRFARSAYFLGAGRHREYVEVCGGAGSQRYLFMHSYTGAREM